MITRVDVEPKFAARELRELARWSEYKRKFICDESFDLPTDFQPWGTLENGLRHRLNFHYFRVWEFLRQPEFLPYDPPIAFLFSQAMNLVSNEFEERGNEEVEFRSEGTTSPVFRRTPRPPGLAPGQQWPAEVVTPSKRFVDTESVKSFVLHLLRIVDQIEAAISTPAHPISAVEKPKSRPLKLPATTWSGSIDEWPEAKNFDCSGYEDSKQFYRDVWLYVQRQSEKKTINGIIADLGAKVQKVQQSWEYAGDPQTITGYADRVAKYLGWPQTRRKGGRKKGSTSRN